MGLERRIRHGLLLSCILLGMAWGGGCTDEKQQQADMAEIKDLVRAHKDDEGLAKLSKYLELHEGDTLAWVLKGNIHEKRDANEQAKLAYQHALEADPNNVQAINGLGILANKRGDYDDAMKLFTKVTQIDPNYAGAWSSMVTAELKKGHDKRALEIAEKAVKLDPKNPVLHANLAIAYHYNNLTAERGKEHDLARDLGYKNMKSLEEIFLGIIRVR